jgi:hypothetical protein
LELFGFKGEDYQKFTLEHVVDGYYKIITVCGKVLSIHEDYVNDERYIWQAFYGGWDFQHWKFEKTDRGTYVIRLQSSEPYDPDWCMSAGDGVIISDGRNVEQREYDENDGDYKDEWLMYQLGTDAMLLAVHETDGRDRISAYGSVMYSLSNIGINNFNLIYTNYMDSNSCLTQMKAARIFISRTHGAGNDNHSYILLNSMGEESILSSVQIFDFSANTARVDFSNVNLLLFVGCKTAWGGNGNTTNNLIVASVNAGADFAVGFEDTINCDGANTWTEYFCEYYSDGQSVWDAAANAANDTAEDHFILELQNKLGTHTFCVAH